MERINNIHFIGIGGIGMSGIAEVMLNQGYTVSGSDVQENASTKRLAGMGARVDIGHRRENLGDVDVVVTSSAIGADNPEIVEAGKRGVPVIPRAEMLSEMMRKKRGIAVSGTHGKTTTTSMIANMLEYAGENPTYVIGGRLISNDRNARLGGGDYFVAEADESDGSFLLFHPVIAVITNIDNDHLGSYKSDMQNLVESFSMFASDLPFYGAAIVCMDDESVASIVPHIHRRIISYGVESDSIVRGANITHSIAGVGMDVRSEKYNLDRRLEMRLHGKHNALNALASICVGLELGLDEEVIFRSLEQFKGISRRFNVYSLETTDKKTLSVIDDYGHHPTEIDSVLQTVSRVFPGRRIVFVFEPHRYSRVRDLFDGFVESLAKADYILVLPVYAASESEIGSASSSAICAAVRSMGAEDVHAVSDHEAAIGVLSKITENHDVVLFMGAGSIGDLVRKFLDTGRVAS